MDRLEPDAVASQYERDFFIWTQEQAAALGRRDAAALDWDNLAEEIDALGRSERHAVDSHFRTLIEHLLKLAHSPAVYPRGDWMATTARVRDQLQDCLTATLVRTARDNLAGNYLRARRVAALALAQDGLTAADLPAECPWTLDQLLDPDFWPS